ncbi:MAG: glycosyltransferase family 2 protein [Proteobacteria bacterium]|nr:glycosyltransferase family 2 protein [Pseudomonadota bacterium]NOG59146.1 glycosyltransferase family 2 protein [Pseudomonadota bacterium]
MYKISVIIPTYNRASVLPGAIDSVLAQSHAADEIIIVDDGSTDETQQLIESRYPQIKLISQTNQGVSAARNNGIKIAQGNWICLLDSDDIWLENKLEKQIEALNKNPDYLICHTNETWIRNGVILNQGKKHEKRGGNIFQHCLPLCVISPSSVMINKKLFDEVGLFDKDLLACEDYDMWLRICSKYPVLFIDEALINKFGGHNDQLSRQHWGMDRFRILALDKSIQSNNLNDDDRQAAIKMLQHKITIFLKGAEKHGDNEYCEKFKALLIQHTKQYA